MNILKGLPFVIAGAPLVRRMVPRPANGLPVVLYHGFFFAGDSKRRARDRLRRQLDWLRSAYNPLTLAQFSEAVSTGQFPPRSLLVTVDDAKVDLLEVHDEFHAFDVPLAVFVCAGWTAQVSEPEPDDMLARVVTTLEWYSGPDVALTLGNESRTVMIGRAHRSASIDQILTSLPYYQPHLEQLLEALKLPTDVRRPRKVCTWPELVSLGQRGVQFGSHSVSHIWMAPTSDVRLQFEVHEAKRLIDQKLALCTSFAYPFGVDGTADERTTSALKAAGLSTAFMTHPGFASSATPTFHLPRLALPERHMTDAEYRSRVRGNGMILSRLKNALTRAR